MQIDNDLLDFAIKNKLSEPIFRLYAWSPACVSLGRNQNDDFLDKEFLKSKNIDVIKRLTGGRALLHDKELTYSYICPIASLQNGESVVNSYKEISKNLVKGFEKLGIELKFGQSDCVKTLRKHTSCRNLKYRLYIKRPYSRISQIIENMRSRLSTLSVIIQNPCRGMTRRVFTQPQGKKPHTKQDYCMSISTGADLSFEGKKFIGSAQFRKEGYILQHGSVLFNYNKDLIEQLFNEKVDENSLTCLNLINPDISCEEVIRALHDTFINQGGQVV